MQPLAHFKTITHHRHLVCRYCFRLGLYRQGLLHDLSKYAPCEFWRGAKYYQGYRSPNDAERKQNGVSPCLAASQGTQPPSLRVLDRLLHRGGRKALHGRVQNAAALRRRDVLRPHRGVQDLPQGQVSPTPRRMTTISARRAISSSTPRRATPSRRCCACSATRARTPRSPTFAACCGRKRKENRQKPLFPRFLPCIFSFTGVNYLSNFAIGRTQLL